jgi:hypothetical protein
MTKILSDDEKWVLAEAARPQGICPHSKDLEQFLVSLETRGWLRQSNVSPVWFITDAGREAAAH